MVNLWLIIGITIYLVGGDWNHGILTDFPYIGNGRIIPTDELHFSEGFKPPTRLVGPMTTQGIP